MIASYLKIRRAFVRRPFPSESLAAAFLFFTGESPDESVIFRKRQPRDDVYTLYAVEGLLLRGAPLTRALRLK